MVRATVCASAALLLSLSATAQDAQVKDYDVIYAPAMTAPKATQAVLTDIAVTEERWVAVGDYGVIVTREKASQEWQQAEVPTSVFLTSVDFATTNIGWAVGHHGVVLNTTDGGLTWTRQLDGFGYIDLQVAYYEEKVATLEAQLDAPTEDDDAATEDDLTFALDDALFQLDNANFAKEEGPTKPFLDVVALSADEVFVSGAYGALLYSNDGGASWTIRDQAIENPDGYHLNAFEAAGDTLYLTGEAGQLFRSLDRGASWETLDSPYYGSLFDVHVDAEQRLWLVGLRGNIFVSDDQGASFSAISLGDAVNINSVINAPTGGVYLAGNAGVVAFIDAAGQLHKDSHPSGAAVSAIAVTDAGDLILVGQRGVLSLAQPQSGQKGEQ